MAKLILVDDHILLRNGLANLLKDNGHEILLQADNGKDLIKQLSPEKLPDVILLDINMPEMDGYDTAKWIRSRYPSIKILALSMHDEEASILRMLRNGAKGYILKDSDPKELNAAINSLVQKGYYHSEIVSGKLMGMINMIDHETGFKLGLKLNDREIEFLKYACMDLNYKEIADKMALSPRTVDGYRDTLYEKLRLKTRIGLVLFALKNGIAKI
jgi:two-component system, NarL family, invasion response regulator UvrY